MLIPLCNQGVDATLSTSWLYFFVMLLPNYWLGTFFVLCITRRWDHTFCIIPPRRYACCTSFAGQRQSRRDLILCEGSNPAIYNTGIAKAARQMTGLSSVQAKTDLKPSASGFKSERRSSGMSARWLMMQSIKKSSQAICSLRRGGSGRRIRTLTYGVRVRCATFTQSR